MISNILKICFEATDGIVIVVDMYIFLQHLGKICEWKFYNKNVCRDRKGSNITENKQILTLGGYSVM